jgi:hypothetical protein
MVGFCKSAPPTFLLRPVPPPGAQLFCAPRPLRLCAPAHPDLCEIEEELLTARPLGVDEDEVEILALAESIPEACAAVEDDSAYRVPISLKEARRYMDELKYFIQKNLPAMERHVEPGAALIKDLTAMHISAHSVQSSIHAFFLPAPRRPRPDSDSGGCAAGGKAR